MHKAVISDTSCLIILTNIDELILLHRLYDNVITTTEVVSEFGEKLPEWFIIADAENIERRNALEQEIDRGEASAIALALEMDGVTIILDDYKARKVAIRLGLEITGTLGILVKARKKGIIPSIKPLLSKLKATNFRLTEELEKFALKEAGESN